MKTLRAIDALQVHLPVFDAQRVLSDHLDTHASNSVGHAAVIDSGQSGKFLGLIDTKDLLTKKASHRVCRDLTNGTSPIHFRPETPLQDVFCQLESSQIDAAGVVDVEGKYIGAVFSEDVKRLLSHEPTVLSELNAHLAMFSTEKAADAIYWIDKEGQIRYANESASRMTGYSQEELIHKTLFDIDPLQSKQDFAAQWSRARNQPPRMVESTHFSKDGRIIYVEIVANIVSHKGCEFNCVMVRDVTKRKRLEVDLLNALHERRFRAIFEQAEVGVCQVTPEGRWIEINDRGCEIFGYSREELLDLTFQQITYPEDLEENLKLYRQVMSGAISRYSMEKRYIRKDGSVVWVGLSTTLVRHETGEPAYFIAIFEDISARKKAQQDLIESESRLRLAVQSSNIGLWDWDITTNKAHYSKEWKSQLGYEEHEIRDDLSEWESRVHPDDLPVTLNRLRAYFAQPNTPHEVEYRMRHKDGSWRWIYTRGESMPKQNGEHVRMLGCHVDITEIKNLTESVRSSEMFLQSAFGALDLHTVVVDQSGTIVLADQAWREFAKNNGGNFSRVLEGANYLEVCDKAASSCNEAKPVAQLLRAALAGLPPSLPIEYPCHSPTEKRWYLFGVRGFIHEGKRYAVVTHQNITAMKLMALREAETKQREAAANIAASVAHEFSSILFAASMQFHLRENRSESELVEANNRALTLVRQAQTLAKSLLNLYQNPDRVTALPMGLYPWLPQTMHRLLVAAPPGIEFTVDVEFDLPEVIAHPLGLEQVLRNIIFNAVDALGESGKLHVNASRAIGSDPEMIEIRVSDNGPGVPRELADKIFTAGFSTSPRSHRSGLGLTIATRMLEQFGGTISYQPNMPKGSTFVIRLLARVGDEL